MFMVSKLTHYTSMILSFIHTMMVQRSNKEKRPLANRDDCVLQCQVKLPRPQVISERQRDRAPLISTFACMVVLSLDLLKALHTVSPFTNLSDFLKDLSLVVLRFPVAYAVPDTLVWEFVSVNSGNQKVYLNIM